jgi:RND superfamily putative drug exporter
MSAGPFSLSAAVVRHRRWIAFAWLALAAVLLPRARHVAEFLDVGASVRGSESAEVERLLAGPLASQYARIVVLVIGGTPSPATPAGSALLREIADSVRLAPQVMAAFSWLDRPDSLFLPRTGGGTFIIVGLAASVATPDRLIGPLRSRTETLAARLQARQPGLTLRWTGETALNVDLRETSGTNVRRAERRALPMTAVLLLIAFGAIVAALLPVFCGGLAIVLALGVAAVLARTWPLSIMLQSLVSMLGLGLGIDYALLTVSRFREGLDAGHDPVMAAEDAVRHAGHTILLSAAAVAVGFVALLSVPLNEIRAIAVGGMLIVTVSALLATTLLPGLLAMIGGRVDWGPIGRRTRGAAGSTDRWRRLGRSVTTHPARALALGAIPLVVLAAQATRLRTGLPRGNWLPATMESASALADLGAMGRASVIQGIRVVVEFPAAHPVTRSAGWNALGLLSASLRADSRVERVRTAIDVAGEAGMGRSALTFLPDSAFRGLVSSDGRLALVEVLPREEVTPDELMAWVRELRASSIDRMSLPGVRLLVGGLPAFNADYSDAAAGQLLQVVELVVAGTLLALLTGTRSILVPVKAVALNLLSVAAAFGALTLVFQEGAGGRLFGLAVPLGSVFSTLPVIVFCIVFGLSMDYEVFLITRVMEERHAGRSDQDAIIEALGTTGRVITSAAAIMLVVFLAFTAGDFLFLKMLGFTLAVAVLLDATMVRMVIGPALLQLAGRWNWWPGTDAAGGGWRARPRSP